MQACGRLVWEPSQVGLRGALDLHCPQHQEGGWQCLAPDAGFLLIYGRRLFTVSLFQSTYVGRRGTFAMRVCPWERGPKLCLALSGRGFSDTRGEVSCPKCEVITTAGRLLQTGSAGSGVIHIPRVGLPTIVLEPPVLSVNLIPSLGSAG